jgi:hypothetical protein
MRYVDYAWHNISAPNKYDKANAKRFRRVGQASQREVSDVGFGNLMDS